MKYQAIGFDYGGVIGGIRPPGTSEAGTICEILSINRDEYRKHYFALNHLMMLGELTDWREFWTLFLQKVDKTEKLSEVLAVDTDYAENLKKVDERQLDLIDQLRVDGYKVGLLTNTTIAGANTMRELGIPEHFDVFFASAEEKLMKPDPLAFKAFANKLGVDPSKMVFIDDAEKSLSTAEECGFMPILFQDYDQLVDELGRIGVLVEM